MNRSIDRTFRHVLIRSVDPFKALLILVVVLDHNDAAHALFPATFRPLTFHVLGFLLLPFVIGESKLSKTFVFDRIARYGVPQFWILTVSAALLWFAHNRAESTSRVVGDYLLALFVGSAPLVKQSSGFLAYWFLPTLLGLVIVLAAYQAISRRWRLPVIGCFIGAHLMVVDHYFRAYQWVPLGLAIVANVFVLGLLFRVLVDSKASYALRWLAPPVFVLSYAWLVYSNTWLEIAVLRLASVRMPTTFIVQDVAALSGIFTILLLADLARRSGAINSIGRLSLMVYLIHPLAYAAFAAMMSIVRWHPQSNEMIVVYGLLSYFFALFIAWATAHLIACSRTLKEWITPRGWRGWPPVANLVPAGAAK